MMIYNCMGQEVRTINNIVTREIKFDRDNLPGGFYFFQIRQDNTKIIASGKMVIE